MKRLNVLQVTLINNDDLAETAVITCNDLVTDDAVLSIAGSQRDDYPLFFPIRCIPDLVDVLNEIYETWRLNAVRPPQ